MATTPNRQFGDMRGQKLRNLGKPVNATDALTWGLPQYSTTDINALKAIKGTIIFNLTTLKLNFYDGATWRVITST